ncbi:hypothetical protein DDB_G0272540 [Dictyostelium discoideum AX4]|uniref:Uncharacterized protein n=1 Tax=Dictyostelium discoideum TaxID=44689 RepID=Q559K3_DICDI|nr:hypothetical protein DDB_G0272540 [Dictyostelium discoideum AX4]EAL71194.1 hypothetical protein DDB_G0272540 [Dictyostelium discoideum AX4]|eukprot:XP_645103.1 hypothetical protein DDB_G0272540 [Dictyostelium discoideum AX4]
MKEEYNINNNNKKLQNYICKNIVELLINYLLKSKKKRSNSNNNSFARFEKKQFILYLDEIITLSLVSKKWFKIISDFISNGIIEQKIIDYWFSDEGDDVIILHRGEDTMKSNEYSLIKIDATTIDDFFSSKYYYIESFKGTKFNPVKTTDDEPIKFINNNKTFKRIENNEIKILLQITDKLNESVKVDLFRQSIDEDLLIPIKENDNIIVENLELEGINMEYSLSNIFNFQPKHIKYDPNGPYCQDSYYHMDYSQLFNPNNLEISTPPTLPLSTNRTESIKIDISDHVEPSHLHNLEESFPNLNSLSIPMLLHDLFICANDKIANLSENGCDYHYGELEKTSNIKQDWDKMIYSLTNCKSLNNLSISNFCSYGFDCIENNNNNFITNDEPLSNGLQKLLSCKNIQYLKLIGFDFIKDINKVFSSLVNNCNNGSSIKTLILQCDCSHYKKSFEYCHEISNCLLSNIYNLNLTYLKINFVFSNDEHGLKILSFIFDTLIQKQQQQQRQQLKERNDENENIFTFNDSRLNHIEFSLHLKHFDTIFGKIKSLSNDQSKIPNSYPIVKEIHMCISMTDKKEKVLLKKRIQDEYYMSNLNDHRTIINIL